MVMSHHRVGRLPDLRSIGRTKCVDLEEGPDDLDDDTSHRSNRAEDREVNYHYDWDHPDLVVTVLDKSYELHENHVFRKSSTHLGGFTHRRRSVAMSKKYADLQALLAKRCVLELIRELVNRVNSTSQFVVDLRYAVLGDCQTLHDVCSSAGPKEEPTTRLEYLAVFCEDLRVHLNHWVSLKQLAHTGRHTSALLPYLHVRMDVVRRQFTQLIRDATCWIYALIQLGFRILGHCDLDRLSQETLWNIARGLEDFNSIVHSVHAHHQIFDPLFLKKPVLAGICQSSSWLSVWALLNKFRVEWISKDVEDVRPVPVETALRLIAEQRAKYAAAATKEYVVERRDYLRLLRVRLPEYSWHGDTSEDGRTSALVTRFRRLITVP